MSVFGGDSWGREAQYRKRRVDDLLVDGIADINSYKKLSSGSRHRAAESRLKERELSRQKEMKKRVALLPATANTDTSAQGSKLADKPYIEQTRKASLEIIQSRTPQQSTSCETQVVKFSKKDHIASGPSSGNGKDHCGKEVDQQQQDYRALRERELKFTAAGWKRDCHGGWFRDENVEFDSDEEDPNISLPR
ncbi:hypothetical protein LguiB_022155 [Lonicera macranthoides]